jgi:hypothetical protein
MEYKWTNICFNFFPILIFRPTFSCAQKTTKFRRVPIHYCSQYQNNGSGSPL